MNKKIIFGICILILIMGCDSTLDKQCGDLYDIDDCNYPKCMYENSEQRTPKYRAALLNNYYECRGDLNENNIP